MQPPQALGSTENHWNHGRERIPLRSRRRTGGGVGYLFGGFLELDHQGCDLDLIVISTELGRCL